MIRYLKNSEIDKDAWNRCIASSVQRIVYGYSFYLDIVSPDWEALVYGEYEAVFPLTQKRKYAISYLYQPAFTQQLGMFSKPALKVKTEDFLKSMPTHFRLIEISLNTKNYLEENCGFNTKEKLTHHLDLNREYENILASYSENLKRNLKKSSVKNKVLISNNIHALTKLFETNKGKKIKVNLDKRILCRLYDELKKLNNATLLTVQDEAGKLSGGALFVRYDNYHIFLFSATSEEGRKNAVMHSIIDHYIKENALTPTILDFEGSMDVNLARFYKSFGSKEVVYLQLLKNNLPPLIRWLK